MLFYVKVKEKGAEWKSGSRSMFFLLLFFFLLLKAPSSYCTGMYAVLCSITPVLHSLPMFPIYIATRTQRSLCCRTKSRLTSLNRFLSVSQLISECSELSAYLYACMSVFWSPLLSHTVMHTCKVMKTVQLEWHLQEDHRNQTGKYWVSRVCFERVIGCHSTVRVRKIDVSRSLAKSCLRRWSTPPPLPGDEFSLLCLFLFSRVTFVIRNVPENWQPTRSLSCVSCVILLVFVLGRPRSMDGFCLWCKHMAIKCETFVSWRHPHNQKQGDIREWLCQICGNVAWIAQNCKIAQNSQRLAEFALIVVIAAS